MIPARIVPELSPGADLTALLLWDEHLFDNLQVPEGLDKDTAVARIMMKCGHTSLEYPNPDHMKYYIGVWSKVRLPIWEKLLATTMFEYNPIHNYDRTEEGTDVTDDVRNIDRNVTDNSDRTISNTTNGTTATTDSSKHDVSADNVSTYSPDYQDSGSQNVTEETTNNGTDNVERKSTDNTSDTGNSKLTHNLHISGNIGVTTTQQMIEEERRVVNYSLYDVIADDFHTEFCLYLY